jgi:2-keto-4-pentenoate hydratase
VVNILVEQGYSIAPGQFVLTGKIGDKVDVTPGQYLANYGPLGTVGFTVIGCASHG